MATFCCVFRVSVKQEDAVPLEEACIEDIVSNLSEEISERLLPSVFCAQKTYPDLQLGGRWLHCASRGVACVFLPFLSPLNP